MPRARLPRLPTRVWSPGGPIRVRRIRRLADSDDGALLDGEWRPHDREIVLTSELAPEAAWHVLAHELTHAWLDDSGFRESRHELVERICDAVACGLVLNAWQIGSRSITD